MKTPSDYRLALVGMSFASLVIYFSLSVPKLQQTTVDDAFMFLRYAKHWLTGNGFSWNTAEGPAHGITSVTHLLIVTALRGLTNLPDPLVITLVSFVAGLAAVAVLTTSGFVFFPHLRKHWSALLVIPFIVLGQLFATHSVTGLETTLALFFNSVFIVTVLYFAKQRSILSLGLCLLTAYLSFLTRPDMGLYCLIFPPLFLMAEDTKQWRQGACYILAFVLLLVVDLFVKKALFGDFLPLPFYAKSSGFYRGYLGASRWNAGDQNFIFFREALPWLLVVVGCASRATIRKLVAIFLPMLLTFGYFATVIQITGLDARYYYPSLPFVILGAFLTMQDYAQEHLQDSLPQLRIHPWRALAAILLLIVFTLPLVETSVKNTWQALMIPPATPYRVQRPFRTPTSVTLPPLGWWKGIIEINALLKKLPSNLVLACSEYGYIGSEHPALPIIDLVGLHDRKVAYAGFSARSVLAQKPDIIWFPHTDYTFEITEIIDNEDFRNSYEFYPKVYNYGIAVRKDSSEKAIIQKELTNEFERVYPGYLLSDFKAEPIGVPHPPISAPVNPDQSTPGASPEQQSGN